MAHRDPLQLASSAALRLLTGLLLLLGTTAFAGETQEEFAIGKDRTGRESILDLVFGAPPRMATERGILLINAFDDHNANGIWDTNEEELDDDEIFCLVDDIEYAIPAFIPGLAYDDNYRILCDGEHFRPNMTAENIFIGRRGQIIRLYLPCHKDEPLQ